MPVFLLLVIALIGVPILELYLLISVGRVIGAGYTILLVIATAVAGAWMLRLQGIATLASLQVSLDRGEVPAVTMVEGLVLLITGVLLLTPGFFTDVIGFACLVPPLRHRLARFLLERLVAQRGIVIVQHGATTQSESKVIEGEYRREE